jgi:membrane fusion protein (multidrug efflux system)
LDVGDSVVVAGQQRLQKDGTLVRIVDMSKGQGGAANSAPGAAQAGPGAAANTGKPADAATSKDASKSKGKTAPVTGENPCLRGLNAAR